MFLRFYREEIIQSDFFEKLIKLLINISALLIYNPLKKSK